MTANWCVETLDVRVDQELEAMPADVRSRLMRIAQLIEEFGPVAVGMPHIRSLGRGLWELRAGGRDAIGRGIYVVASGRRVVIVHAFIKKTQQTPERTLQIALQRAKEARLL